jgi:hemoglobin
VSDAPPADAHTGDAPPGEAHAGDPSPASVFSRVGSEFFDRLTAAFYASVRTDPVLLALYPHPDDLAGAARRLSMFLAQYWGGPTTYSDERGHPRLRMRHAAYPIDDAMRDRWLKHMNAALDACGAPPDVTEEMREYFARASHHLRNV